MFVRSKKTCNFTIKSSVKHHQIMSQKNSLFIELCNGYMSPKQNSKDQFNTESHRVTFQSHPYMTSHTDYL